MTNIRAAAVAILGGVLLSSALAGCGGDAEKKSADKPTMDPALAALPQASADLMIAPFGGEAVGERITPGDAGRFALPGQTMSISSLTVVDTTIDPDGAGDGEVRPADGERFVVVQLTHAADDRYEFTPPPVQVLIEDAGKRVNVADDVTGGQPFLVSVGDDAQLVLTADGRDFTASLGGDNLGQVETSAREGDHSQDFATPIDFAPVTVKAIGRTGEFGLSATIRSVRLSQYLPSELAGGTGKWASSGQAFVMVSIEDLHTDRSGGTISSDDGPILTWSVEANEKTYPGAAPVVFDGNFHYSDTAVIEVPADLRSFTLTASAKTPLYLIGGGRKTVSNGDVTVDVVLP